MKLYFPIINLLRGIAALMVCVYHFTAYSDFRGDLFPKSDAITEIGQYGIQGIFIFFVISGVVIPVSLFSHQFTLKTLHKFLLRRWVRIEIPYIASIAIVLAVALAFALKNNESFVVDPLRVLHHLTYTVPFTDHEWYNVIYWTLAIEFQYYIVIGLIYPLLVSPKKYTALFTLLMFSVLSLILPDNRLVFYYAPVFSLGILIFLLRTKKLNEFEWGAYSLLLLPLLWYVHGAEIALFSLFSALTIVYIKVRKKSFRIGDISYSLYLTHGAIGGSTIYLLARYTDSYLSRVVLVSFALLASLAFAYVFWRIIEAPSRAWSRKVKIGGKI